MVAPIAQRLACVVDDGDDTDTTSNGVGVAKTTTVITPRPSEKPLLHSIVTPDQNETKNDTEVNNRGDGDDAEAMISTHFCDCREVEEARRDAQQSAQALDDLVTGIRTVKRILEREAPAGADDDSRIVHDDDEEDLTALSLISEKLHGVLGSDLLGLLNAADMVRTHSRLTFAEASALVNDVAEAKSEALKAQENLRTTKKIARSLYKENIALKKEVRQLQSQRKVLVKEVKVLRDNAEVTKQYDSWRLLENHVLNALKIHEQVLKTPTTPKVTEFSPSDIIATAEPPSSSISSRCSSSSINAVERIESGPSSDSESELDTGRCQPGEESLVVIAEEPISDDSSNREQATILEKNGKVNQLDEKKEQEVDSNTNTEEKTMDKAESTTARGSVTLSGFADGLTGGLRSFFGSNSTTPKTTRTAQQDTTPQGRSKSNKEEGQSHPGTSSLVPDTMTEEKASDSSNRVITDDVETVEGASASKEPEKNGDDTVEVLNPSTPKRPTNSREHRHQPKSPGSKSNVPGLEEISGCCTDETYSSATIQTRDSEEECSKFPTEFSVQIPSGNREPCSSPTNCYASPLISPAESPSGVIISQPKPMCDEKILRTLAIPSSSSDRHVSSTTTAGRHVLHRRRELESDKTELESGLYEC